MRSSRYLMPAGNAPERSVNDVRELSLPYRDILRDKVTLLGRQGN